MGRQPSKHSGQPQESPRQPRWPHYTSKHGTVLLGRGKERAEVADHGTDLERTK